MNKRFSINPVLIGRISFGIILVGFSFLFSILQSEGYNGLNGTDTNERIFLLLIIVGGIMGIVAYSKKKTACSALSGIAFVMVMISAVTMYLNKQTSNQGMEPTSANAQSIVPED